MGPWESGPRRADKGGAFPGPVAYQLEQREVMRGQRSDGRDGIRAETFLLMRRQGDRFSGHPTDICGATQGRGNWPSLQPGHQ
jgi:hypothetical protein